MRTFLVRLLFSVLFFCLTVRPGAAGQVHGQLLDPDGRPVAGATVMLADGATVIATAFTDEEGRFVLTGPDAGSFELRAAVTGFRTPPVRVDGAAGTADLGPIALAVSAVSESVVVSAAQVEIPLSAAASSVTVLSGDELRARQLESLADALRLVPGLTVSANGGRGALTALYPRGGESDYSLVLIDGVPANSFGGLFDFSGVPLADVDRIEVVRGPQSALYGSNAIGSVVRVVTRRGGPPIGQAVLEGGSFATSRASAAASGTTGPWSWHGSAERLASDGMNGREIAFGAVVGNDDYARHGFAGGLGWQRADGAGVRGEVRYLADERGNPGPFGSDPGGTFAGIDLISRGSNDRWLSSISGSTAAGRRIRLQGTVSHGRFDADFVDPYGSSASYTHRTDGRVQADIVLRPGLDASAGVEFLGERAGSTFITATGARQIPVTRSIAGVFAEGRWNHDSRVFLTAGLRAERITRGALAGDESGFPPRPDFPEDTVVSVNPKLAAAWLVRDDPGTFTRLRASAGTGIRPPDAFEIAYTDNPSLVPERSRSVDAGVDQSLLGGLLLVEATAFYNSYDDLIIAVGPFNGSSRYQTDNISNARARGVETAATGRLRLGTRRPTDVELRGSYTYLRTAILDVDLGSGAPAPFISGDPLLRRPAHQFGLNLMVRSGRLQAFVDGGGRGRFTDVDPSLGTFGGVYEAAGYTTWSAGAAWRIVPALELYGRVTNLFDRTYEEALGFPALGRGAMVGLRVAAGR